MRTAGQDKLLVRTCELAESTRSPPAMIQNWPSSSTLAISAVSPKCQRRITAHICTLIADRLPKYFGQILLEPLAVDADRQDRDPQADVVAIARSEAAGAAIILFEMFPMRRVLQPVCLGRMDKGKGRPVSSEDACRLRRPVSASVLDGGVGQLCLPVFEV